MNRTWNLFLKCFVIYSAEDENEAYQIDQNKPDQNAVL